MKKIGVLLVCLVATFSSCKKDEPQLSYSVQLAKDQGLIDEFLTDNHVAALLDTSGIRYVVRVQGTGKIPGVNDTVAVEITGHLLSNKNVFNSDTSGNRYVISQLIVGLKDGILRMPKGSTYTFYIPSGLAFGQTGSSDGAVGANTNVYFDVKLLDDDAQLKTDVAIIDKYLRAAEDSAVRFSSGLRMIIIDPGSGNPPTHTSDVTVTYIGKFLNGVQFDTETMVLFHASDVIISGIRQGLANLRPGGHAIIYIPSKLGYGFSGTDDGTIPRSAILVFDMHLISAS